MQLPAGYDKWRLQGPPEYGGPTCDGCGAWQEIRVDPGCAAVTLVCVNCFEGPDFSDLQFAQDYFIDQDDLRADYEHDRRRDDRRNP